MEAHNVNSTTAANGRFLRLDLIEYQAADASFHKWEAAQRNIASVAALVVATLRPGNKIILVKQFRPPIGAYALELPAGLVDPGEDILAAAVRELKEETGYTGKPIWQTGPCASSAGLSGELVSTVFMDIDATSSDNINPTQNLQDNEDIQVLVEPMSALPAIFADAVVKGLVIDSRLAVWAAANGMRW